jgi:hypothetical protein
VRRPRLEPGGHVFDDEDVTLAMHDQFSTTTIDGATCSATRPTTWTRSPPR